MNAGDHDGKHHMQMRGISALVVLHPKACCKGPDWVIEEQQYLISGWDGPVLAVETGEEDYPARFTSPAGSDYLDTLRSCLQEEEDEGQTCRFNSRNGDLSDAMSAMIQAKADVSEFVLTGSLLEQDIRAAAEMLANAGFLVEIDSSALSEEILAEARIVQDNDLFRWSDTRTMLGIAA